MIYRQVRNIFDSYVDTSFLLIFNIYARIFTTFNFNPSMDQTRVETPKATKCFADTTTFSFFNFSLRD